MHKLLQLRKIFCIPSALHSATNQNTSESSLISLYILTGVSSIAVVVAECIWQNNLTSPYPYTSDKFLSTLSTRLYYKYTILWWMTCLLLPYLLFCSAVINLLWLSRFLFTHTRYACILLWFGKTHTYTTHMLLVRLRKNHRDKNKWKEVKKKVEKKLKR